MRLFHISVYLVLNLLAKVKYFTPSVDKTVCRNNNYKPLLLFLSIFERGKYSVIFPYIPWENTP